MAGAITVAIGASVLVGWALDIPTLKSVHPTFVSMKANSALTFIAIGTSLWLLGANSSAPARRLARACAGGAAASGLLTLIQYMPLGCFQTTLDLQIDQILFQEAPGAVGTSSPGRMAPTTALSFVLVGSALLLLDTKTRRGRWPPFALTLPVALLALLALVGYALGIRHFYGIGSTTAMALHTALLFLVIAAGILCARPEQSGVALLMNGGAGSVMARRLLSVALGAPFLLGWLIAEGWRNDLYTAEFGASLLVIACMVLFFIVVWTNALALDRMDADRFRALEERVRCATREEAARAALGERDEFLSVAAHELRTPVAALKLGLQSLQRWLRGSGAASVPPERVLPALEGANQQIDRMAKLIERLLDLSRIRAGRLDLVPERVDLAELVRQATEPLREALTEAGCSLVLRDRDENEVVGLWDPLRLGQVVTNLVSNAMKYGAGAPIEIEVSERGGRAVIAVSDHGIGIAPSDIERIFGRFERVASPRNQVGLGIGLFVTRQIVELHGGSIRVESVLGEGSTFLVELPRGLAAAGDRERSP